MDGSTHHMTIRVLLFGSVRDRAGTGSVDVEVPTASTVREVVARTVEVLPALAGMVDPARAGTAYAVAVDRAYADPDAPCSPGCEVAVIPPVSGG